MATTTWPAKVTFFLTAFSQYQQKSAQLEIPGVKEKTMEPLYASNVNKLGANSSQAGKFEQQLRQASVELEAAFLAEMLKAAGLESGGVGPGGAGKENEFGSFLTRAYATEIARTGGIGLADFIFRSLVDKADD